MKRMSKCIKTVLSLVLALALVIPTTAYAAEEKYIEAYDEEVYLYVGNWWSFAYEVFPEETAEAEDWTCTWESGDANVFKKVNDSTFEAVAAGTTTVTVTTESGLTDTISVNVIEPIKWDGVKTEKIIFNTRYYERSFEVTVPEDGMYRFTGEKVDSHSAEFVLLEDDDYRTTLTYMETYNGIDSQVYLEADKTYVLEGWTYSGMWAYDLTLEKIADDVEEEEEEETEDLFRQDGVTIAVGEKLYLPEFVQTSDDIMFASDDETVVVLDSNVQNELAIGIATGSAVITAETEDGERDTMKITVVEPEKFDMNTSKNFMLGDGLLNKMYKITLEENDDRLIMSQSEDMDTYGIIIDSEGKAVASCDDYYELNFGFDMAEENLDAGTYYLSVTSYDVACNDDYESYDDAVLVEVEQGEAVAADCVELFVDVAGERYESNGIYYVEADSEVYFYAEFGSSIFAVWEDYNVTIDNTDVIYFDEQYGMYYAKEKGTAVVTLTSENGLTDTATICVIDEFTVGDINLDGVIGSADVNLILDVMNGEVEIEGIYCQGEVNGDNKIDEKDIAALVTSAELIKNPTKTTYTVGEAFDTTGMELKVTFVDGNVETVTDGFVVTGYDATKEGTQKVTISYGNETFPFEVTVVKPSPATGDTTTYAWAIVMILCAGYAVLTFKKRRNG